MEIKSCVNVIIPEKQLYSYIAQVYTLYRYIVYLLLFRLLITTSWFENWTKTFNVMSI